jgi:hypothetical protein
MLSETAKQIVEMVERGRQCDLFKRDSSGLLDNVEYKYRDNGSIDWRAMVNPEFTVINAQYKNELEQIHQKTLDQIQVDEVDDKHLLVLLGGFKELAQIRGYQSVTYRVAEANPDYAGVICRIDWIPNYETGGTPLVFESLADASTLNTSGFGRVYLMAIAENRAFVRCVRNSLGINIVGKDEIGTVNLNQTQVKTFSSVEPHGVLQNLLKEKNKNFNKFRDEWTALGHEDAKDWESINDVPVEQVFVILEAIKKSKK